ncbi:aconitase X [uncultured Microbacterium sp.]|uniref:aconitase X n=1 Tax=uncultured Microbacterium sp. TaxID=191216 RepID=UPI0035CC5214
MLTLDARDEAMLGGAEGGAAALAMRVVVRLGEILGAEKLIDISSAHIDSCLYHGPVSVDFAGRLVELGGAVAVPTTLNVGSVDLLHPGLVRSSTEKERGIRDGGRALMQAYTDLGATATWTCAPYQLPQRPAFGEHIAWAESNAIVFANSVLGARTHRYGDFVDICAALTGRAPLTGLHLDENRRGQVVIDCSGLSPELIAGDVLYPVLGFIAGRLAGQRVPVFVGLPDSVSEDRLKALGAAAASSGGVGLFHIVGRTPEAPTLAAALHDGAAEETHVLAASDIRRARQQLCTIIDGTIDAVSIGTPHASYEESVALAGKLADGPPISPEVTFYLNTNRSVLARLDDAGHRASLEDAGVTLVIDTCTYVTSILRPSQRVVMTNSAKWANYAPANIGVDVVLGSLDECIESARTGRVHFLDATGLSESGSRG